MSYSTLAGIGPLGTPELIILGIMVIVPLGILAAVIIVVLKVVGDKKKADQSRPPTLPPEQR